MNKIIVSIIAMGLLLTISVTRITALGINEQPGQELQFNAIPYANIYVDCKNTQGPWDGTYEHPYQTIQKGINVAENDDRIFVFNGTYTENLNIEKSIDLIGENRSSVIVEGIIDINSVNHVKLRRFTIQNYFCDQYQINFITLTNSNYCDIKDNIINHLYSTHWSSGIGLVDSSYNTVNKNIISNIYGLWPAGIDISCSCNNIISENTINIGGAGTSPTAIRLYNESSFNLISNNIITDITGDISDAIFLVGKEENSGILSVSNNTIMGNFINNIYSGISGAYSAGIHLKYASYNTIVNNQVSNATALDKRFIQGGGIYLELASPNNNISNNFLEDNYIGIGLYSNAPYFSDNNIFSNNTIIKNEVGMTFTAGKNNIVKENNIINNSMYGIFLSSIGIFLCRDNQIYHNNFINNTNNSYDSGINHWYDLSSLEGNYWSDYQLKYPNANPKPLRPWIWDTPYRIDPHPILNVDRYPLVNLYNGSSSQSQPSSQPGSQSQPQVNPSSSPSQQTTNS